MITENMIKAGLKVYKEELYYDTPEFVTAIYKAMSDQKHKDALIAYKASENEVFGHSCR